MADRETVRAFVAVPLPEDVRRALSDLQMRMGCARWPVRWVRPESIHLTLKFLGDIPAGGIRDVAAAVEAAARQRPPFSLRASGAGAFPGVRKARVIWAGVGGDTEGLAEVHRSVQEALHLCGYPADHRPFRAHLTLGRVKGRIPEGELAARLQEEADFASPFFAADRIRLYQSILKPTGAVYRVLGEAALKPHTDML
jgi:2'-5' RNA ligase